MNTILSLASVVAPAAAVALVAGGVCPPEQCGKAPEAVAVSSQALAMSPLVQFSSAQLGRAHLSGLAMGAQPESNTRVRTHIKVVQQDDSGTYELVIENGEPRAKVDGEAVPADRLSEVEDGVWVIEGEDGSVVATFHVGSAPQPPRAPLPGLAPLDLPKGLRMTPPDAGVFQAPAAEQPRTMLGVVMGPAPEDAADAGGVLIERVLEGLPADRAGLESGDIIIEIEGAADVTPGALRALLREKAPGDELKLRVLRNGEEKELAVRLEAFDGGRMVQGPLASELPQALRHRAPGAVGGLSGEARRQMDEALQALREAEQLASGEARQAHEHAREAIEQFVAALERMEAEGLSTGDAMRGELGRWFGQFKDDHMVWGDKPGMVFTLPRNSLQFDRQFDRGERDDNSTASAETGSARIRNNSDVEARLNAMSDRLERIEKLLEKLAADGAPAAAPQADQDR